MSGELSFAFPVHIPIFTILQLSLPELCETQSDHITFTWNGHCACAVSRDLSRGAKIIHIFEISEPNSLCHFYGATTKIKPCYRRKITFSYCEGYKVNCARDLFTGGPPKPHETIF